MENIPDQLIPHQQSPLLPPGEPLPSIQLLPEISSQKSPDISLHRKDKKLPLPPSINNFIQKTYSILQEKQFQSIVSWAEAVEQPVPQGQKVKVISEGCQKTRISQKVVSSFRIHNLKAFEEIVLPKYFKHSNMSSFVRQLNMYSFHKVRGDKNEIQFQHQKFIKNKPEFLSEIKRKQVDSTSSIPSIALICPQNPLVQQDGEAQDVKRQSNPIAQAQEKIGQKKDSSSNGIKSVDDQQLQRLSHLKEINSTLKKKRQLKSLQLKQLLSQKKNQNCDKFNKLIFTLFATKIEHQQSQKKFASKGSKQSFQYIHQIIQHLMGSSQAKGFKEYLEMSKKLLFGQINDRIQDKKE